MYFEEYLKKINEILLKNSGVSGLPIFNFMHESPLRPISSFFFQPYQNKADPFFRTMAILEAPPLLSLFALECAVHCLCHSVNSVIEFAKSNPEAGGSELVSSVLYLTTGFVSVFSALSSPVINLVDLIGSGVNSLRAHEEVEPAMMEP